MIKYGDRVRISKNSQFYMMQSRKDGRTDIAVQHNPLDTDGLVIEDNDNACMFGFNIRVRWENGMVNVYSAQDLEVIDGTNN